MSDWYKPLRKLESRGSKARRPGSLAGLHEARREHFGQFFTTDALALYLWSIVTPAMTRALAREDGGRIALLDNSIGSAKLLQFADPTLHTIDGCDIDADVVRQVARAIDEAGFICNVRPVGMEAVRPKHYSVGLINPPFSVHIESPLLEDFPCTTHGRHGPGTSTLSHAYAVHQAVKACDIVAAILPSSYADELARDVVLSPHLAALFRVPRGSFRDEGTEVDVTIAVLTHLPFGRAPVRETIQSLDAPAPDIGLECRTNLNRSPRLNVHGIEQSEPAVTLPVTGDKRVRIVHNGRRIFLKFACGLVQAQVLNAVYQDTLDGNRIEKHRYPRGIKYLGEGALDTEVHLAQPSPMESLTNLMRLIHEAGGCADLDSGLLNYFKRKIREKERGLVPFRHVVQVTDDATAGAGEIVARVRKTQPFNPKIWGSPIIREGETIVFSKMTDGCYTATVNGMDLTASPEEITQRFEVSRPVGKDWRVIHEGKRAAFPHLQHAWKERLVALGIDQWFDRGYQMDDLIEAMIHPAGSFMAWKMGLGKARLAIAAAVLSQCKHNLITVDSRLIDELRIEIGKIKLDADAWQVIQKPSDLDNLRAINIISYERLRSPINAAHKRRTYASRLRRRVGLVVSDEGDLLRNMASDQTRALWQLCARRKMALSGTPIASYPRDVYPILTYLVGDGTALQPYGVHRPYLSPELRESTHRAERGQDRFREDFITFEWVTNEFAESLSEGAKREIPKIANLAKYRAYLAPHMKRLTGKEPEVVAAGVILPEADHKPPHRIEWDDGHLAFYLKVAEEFANWYREARRRIGDTGKNINLITILARIQAVQIAANYPQRGVAGLGAYAKLTSKQRFTLDRLEELTRSGHKTILYADNPGMLQRFAREMKIRGVDSVIFTGEQSIKNRNRDLSERYRNGNVPLLLASTGVGEKGINIPQADRVLLYNRSWTAKVEDQCIARVLRPEQTRPVVAERAHLIGSIDEYQAQLVAYKSDAALAGIDYADPRLFQDEFQHLDTVLGEFCEGVARLKGCKPAELRKALVA